MVGEKYYPLEITQAVGTGAQESQGIDSEFPYSDFLVAKKCIGALLSRSYICLSINVFPQVLFVLGHWLLLTCEQIKTMCRNDTVRHCQTWEDIHNNRMEK